MNKYINNNENNNNNNNMFDDDDDNNNNNNNNNNSTSRASASRSAITISYCYHVLSREAYMILYELLLSLSLSLSLYIYIYIMNYRHSLLYDYHIFDYYIIVSSIIYNLY